MIIAILKGKFRRHVSVVSVLDSRISNHNFFVMRPTGWFLSVGRFDTLNSLHSRLLQSAFGYTYVDRMNHVNDQDHLPTTENLVSRVWVIFFSNLINYHIFFHISCVDSKVNWPFYISHNTLGLSPKFCINYCFQMAWSWDTAYSEEHKKTLVPAKPSGQKKWIIDRMHKCRPTMYSFVYVLLCAMLLFTTFIESHSTSFLPTKLCIVIVSNRPFSWWWHRLKNSSTVLPLVEHYISLAVKCRSSYFFLC